MLQARNTDQLPKLISTYTESTSKKIEACQRDHKNFLQSVKSHNFRKWLNKGGVEQKIARRIADKLINAEIQWERAVIQFSEEKSKLLSQKKYRNDALINLELGHSLSIDIRGLRTSVYGSKKK